MSQLPIATVIIPTYNEVLIIEKTVSQLISVFSQIKKWQMQILVVDDTSPDKTAKKVQDLQKQYSNLYLLIKKKKEGLGAAYLKGMHYAFDQLHSSVIFQFDADLSHDPTKIPLFLKEIENGSEMVIGSRYIPGGSIPKDWGLHRKLLSKVGNLAIRTILTNFTLTDWTTGYRAIKKHVFETIAPEMTGQRFSGYTFQIGFLYKAVQNKFKITEIPFHFVDRQIGKSKMGPEYIFNNLIFLTKIRLLELLNSRIFKFALVGGVGAVVQLGSLQLYRQLLPQFNFGLFSSYLLASVLSIETAIVSNFILNNSWTFADRQLSKTSIPSKFIQFNLASAGSLLIQLIIATMGEQFIGLKHLFVLPMINFSIDTGLVFAVTGILIGMFWNFFAYNFFIWKKKQ